MKLILIRHAQSKGNAAGRWQGRNETDLSELGKQQAEKLRERFVAESFEPTHVYSSPMIRTSETARISTAAWNYPITPLEDLIEIDVGVFSGKTWEEVESQFPEAARLYAETRNWDHVPQAETMRDRRVRAERAINRIIADHSNEDRVLAFTHGGIIHYLFAALMGMDRMWGISVGNTALFDFDLDVDRWRHSDSTLLNTNLWRINRFNDTSHLD
ncbi:MAG: histidine phosphatase family protein [Chloroflexi bacterium]|nr:histidine phosphatase family protein [Chloroflexota bacterium]